MSRAMGLEHRKHPRIMLVNGRRRRDIHAIYTKVVNISCIPHLIIIMVTTITLVVWVHVLRTQEFVVLFLFHILTYDDFELGAEDDTKTITSNWLFHTRNATTFAPFVEFTTESVCFEFEEA